MIKFIETVLLMTAHTFTAWCGAVKEAWKCRNIPMVWNFNQTYFDGSDLDDLQDMIEEYVAGTKELAESLKAKWNN